MNSIEQYKEYLTGHINNVSIALELLYNLGIPYVQEHIDELREIVKEHDKSKYEEPEWSAYLHHFYPETEEDEMMGEEFDSAVQHHIKNNKHHWNYWCDENNTLKDNINEDEYKLYTIERICDWMSMAGQRGESPTEYYDLNKEFIVQPDYARELCDEIYPQIPEDYAKDMWKIDRGKLDESVLTEMKLSEIKQKSKNQDPARIAKSKNVKTTYIGMSKFGILNFKTTSETRNGYHYQTIEFKDMKPFEDIIKTGNKIMPDDIKKQLKEQDVNIWCTDESFAYWAWAHQAYINDFLYIDDRIPNLRKAIQAPKVNNVRLNGGACKHILSVIDYVMRPFVLLAISDDMNKYLENSEEDKMHKQDIATQNQYDAVAEWDWSEIEDLVGKTRIEILSDISKTLQIVPSTDKGDIITDIVAEQLPEENQGLKREIVDRIEELLDKET